jgi:NAD(P)-dependent dehydrogenase (short-subunit alcohol dehydrogenase family)
MTVVVITNAGTNAAFQTAHDLLRDGHRVVVTDRHAMQLVRYVHRDDSDHVLAIAADSEDPEQMRRLFTLAESRFGPVDYVMSADGVILDHGSALDVSTVSAA